MRLAFIIILIYSSTSVFSQMVPSKAGNFEYLVTFGKDATDKWGDDDKTQINFFSIPEKEKRPIYIKVFDPNIGGKHDQINKRYNSKTKFSVYGGKGSYSIKDARSVKPVGNFKSGILLDSRTFDSDSKYDDKWFVFGPYNPQEGEFDESLNAYVFKVICEGQSGDDGNLYKYFLSTDVNNNKAVQGGNIFSYELTIRLKNDPSEVAHFYPFINDQIILVKQFNFDFDQNGYIRLTSLIKKSHEMNTSGDGNWSTSEHIIKPEEHNTSLDVHYISKKEFSNDVTLYLLDQYKNAIPFFSMPLGGASKYEYNIDVEYKFK